MGCCDCILWLTHWVILYRVFILVPVSFGTIGCFTEIDFVLYYDPYMYVKGEHTGLARQGLG